MLKKSLIIALLAAAVSPAFAAPRDTEMPFILLSKKDLPALKKRIETEAWAKKRFEQDILNNDARDGSCQRNLFKYLVLGDQEAGETEKKILLQFINLPTLEKDTWDWQWHHADVYQHALRYDALADLLTPAERKGVEDTLRKFARWGIEEEPLRGFASYGRHPGQHIAALALRDPRLIRGIFNAKGGMKDTLDNVLDGHFMPDSVNHLNTTWTHLLLWCLACERLGLDEIGFGYVGKNGGSVKGIFEGIVKTGLPRMHVPGHGDLIGKATFGQTLVTPSGDDKKVSFPWQIFPSPLGAFSTTGLPQRSGWQVASSAAYYSGDVTVSRMNLLLAFEIVHKKYPDIGLGYFLTQQRAKGDDKYIPSLWSGLDPIDPASVAPPKLASLHAPQRGFAMLRATEGDAYWSSESPVLIMNMNRGYRGWAGDTMSIHALYAFGRPIYLQSGDRDPWADQWSPSGRAGNSVMVDNFQYGKRVQGMRWVTYTKYPMANAPVTSRAAFDPLVKFVSARSSIGEIEVRDREGKPVKEELAIFPGTTFERAFMLTDTYLLDVFQAKSTEPRDFHFILHTLGEAKPDNPAAWQASTKLTERIGPPDPQNPGFKYLDEKSLDPGDKPWSLRTLQTCALPDPAKSALGAAWYARQVGVNITMLGEPGTTVFTARPAELERKAGAKADPFAEVEKRPEDVAEEFIESSSLKPGEVGGVMIAAHRKAQATTYVTVHEPFEKNTLKLKTIERLLQTENAVGVSVRGDAGIDDRLFVRIGDKPGEVATFSFGDESIAFADRAFIRRSPTEIRVSGPVTGLRLKVAGTPRLVLNGKEAPAQVSNGTLIYAP